MVRVNFVPLSKIDTSTGECAKLDCDTGSYTLHRHHRKHQAIWLGIWAGRRNGEKKFSLFVTRYHEFNPKDWTRLCASHHAEIHLIYDGIIRRDQWFTRRSLSQYSWVQAEKLMMKLEAVCVDWLKKKTPGSSTEALTKLRSKRKAASSKWRKT